MAPSRITILNVNPAALPAGSLNPEMSVSNLRKKMYHEGTVIAREKSGGRLRLLFGATGTAPAGSWILLAGRVLLSVAVTCFGVAVGWSTAAVAISIIAGVMISAGVATRPVAALSAIVFAVISAIGIEMGEIKVTAMLILLFGFLLAFAGPGRYSADAVMKRRIFRMVRRYEMRKLMERRFSYKAMQYQF